MGFGACTRAAWSTALSAEAAAIATVPAITPISAVATIAEAAAARTETAATATVIVSAAEATTTAAAMVISAAEAAATTTSAAARGRWGSRTIELQLGRHRLAAVLRQLKRTALAFTQRLYAYLCQSGDVHEHIGTAVVR